jgi:hypothetical protein
MFCASSHYTILSHPHTTTLPPPPPTHTQADMVEYKKVERSAGQQLADEHGIKFFETSAKTRYVGSLFVYKNGSLFTGVV